MLQHRCCPARGGHPPDRFCNVCTPGSAFPGIDSVTQRDSNRYSLATPQVYCSPPRGFLAHCSQLLCLSSQLSSILLGSLFAPWPQCSPGFSLPGLPPSPRGAEPQVHLLPDLADTLALQLRGLVRRVQGQACPGTRDL